MQCCFTIRGSGRWPLIDSPCDQCPYSRRKDTKTVTNEVEKLTEIIAKCDALRERAEKAEAERNAFRECYDFQKMVSDSLRARAEKAEAEVERLADLHANGCFVEYDNGDRVWGWAGGADTASALSTLSVSYEASDGARWSLTYRATGCWEAAPRAADEL